MSCKLVICDLDGTLISVSSELVFVKGLLRRGVLPPAVILNFLYHYLRHPVRTFKEGRGWNRGYFRGLPVPVMMEEVKGDLPVLLERVRPGVLSLLRERQGQGAGVAILSASITPIVRSVAEALGFSDFRGSSPHAKNGVCTGHLVGQRPWGRAKVAPALALMEQYGAAPEECLALGDSWADRFVMELCGEAVAVDPGGKLAALADARGWRVIERRK